MNSYACKKKQRKEELNYLEHKDRIRAFIDNTGCTNILRYMIEDLDSIEDMSNTQSMYLFQLISSLETALENYPRVKNV